MVNNTPALFFSGLTYTHFDCMNVSISSSSSLQMLKLLMAFEQQFILRIHRKCSPGAQLVD